MYAQRTLEVMGPLDTWMIDKGVGNKHLAEMLQISRVQVSRLRRRLYRPSVETALKLEEITGIPAAELILAARVQ